MADQRATYPRLTLVRAVYGFVAVGVVAVGLGCVAFFLSHSARLVDDALDTAVRQRTQAAGLVLARTLHYNWNDLKFVSQAIPGAAPAEIATLLDGLSADKSRISWIGYSDLSGTVRQASDKMLVGEDVSAEPWFRNGLKTGYGGDVRKSEALSRFIYPGRNEVLSFVDLAHPVRDAQGSVQGVVGVHVNFSWAQRILSETAASLGLDLYLTRADGTVIVATRPDVPSPEELQILRAAAAGTAGGGREVWPDGRVSFASLVPTVTYGDLPNFGWRLVGRLDAEAFHPSLSWLGDVWWIAVAGFLTLLASITAVFSLVFIRPIEHLARSAQQIADGDDVYPPDHKRTRELAQMSSALARLQAARKP